MAINYTGLDLDRYNEGKKFLSLDKYLKNYQTKAPITFNPSQSNTGIMSAYPRPIIPIFPDDSEGGPINPGGPDYGYKSQFDPVTQNKEYLYDMGEGTVEEDDIIKGPGLSRMDMARAAGAYMFTGPLSMMGSLGMSNKRNEQREKDRLNEEIDREYGARRADFADIRDGSAPSGGTWDGGEAARTNPSTGIGGGQFTDVMGNVDYQDELDPGGGEKDGGFIDGTNKRMDFSNGGLSKYAYGGRIGYRDGGYSSEDNEEQQAQDQASFDAGNRTDDYNDMYSGDSNTSVNNINIPTNTSNLDFSMVKDINPAFSYANNVGRFGGMLDTTKTIEEEEPVGTVGYFSPSNNFGIGYDTNLGMVGKANLGNLNIGYTGTEGPTASYMGAFGNDAGRLGVNYDKDGLNLGFRFEKKFNNGGIVGLYR